MAGDTRTAQHPSDSEQHQPGRRDDIMTAAKTVFVRNGFHGSTIADVAKEPGLSCGTVYQYFDSVPGVDCR